MRWSKGHIYTTIIGFVIPILFAIVYFYATSNKNLRFLFESEKIIFVDLDKNYDIELDEDNLILISQEELTITFEYPEIKYNDAIIENGKLTIELDTEFIIHGKYYELTEDFKLKQINYSKKLKEALKENSFIIGFSSIIIVVAVVIAIYMIAKQMDIMKKYRRYSVMISLLMLTLITLVLSMVTTQLFVGFGAVFIAWTTHTISWTIKRKLNNLPLYEDQRMRVVVENE